jgi:hypothetical protein
MCIDDQVPALDPEFLYEECPTCEGLWKGCMTCWDEGLVVHDCETADG